MTLKCLKLIKNNSHISIFTAVSDNIYLLEEHLKTSKVQGYPKLVPPIQRKIVESLSLTNGYFIKYNSFKKYLPNILTEVPLVVPAQILKKKNERQKGVILHEKWILFEHLSSRFERYIDKSK